MCVYPSHSFDRPTYSMDADIAMSAVSGIIVSYRY